jgi:hypothetical protein
MSINRTGTSELGQDIPGFCAIWRALAEARDCCG